MALDGTALTLSILISENEKAEEPIIVVRALSKNIRQVTMVMPKVSDDLIGDFRNLEPDNFIKFLGTLSSQ